MASTRNDIWNYDAVFTKEYMNSAIKKMYDQSLYGMDVAQGASSANYDLSRAREKVAQYIQTSEYSVGWDDVVGNAEARTALLDAIEGPVKHKALYQKYGMKPAKGVLLYGPPGCGKTMFGKAAADALSRLYGTKTELLVINGPSIQSTYVGETEKTIRAIFTYAREYKKVHGHPLVIFIDEADAILPSRNGGYRFEASNVATFLTELDGMNENGAFVILATNRPDHMDEALLRDGRCDRKIKVQRPSYDDAVILAGKAVNGKEWANGVDIGKMVDSLFNPLHVLRVLDNPETGMTHHFLLSHIVSGAMIVSLVERAKLFAIKRELSGEASGIVEADLVNAVEASYFENKGLPHDYALREFVETVAIPFERARAMN